VVSFDEERVQSFSDVNFDLVHGKGWVIKTELVFGHVDIEGFEVFLDFSYLLLKVVLLMVELNVIIPLDVSHKGLNLTFIRVHGASKVIFLPKELRSQVVQGVIIDFKNGFDAFLVLV
jgi:hypothetical protein